MILQVTPGGYDTIRFWTICHPGDTSQVLNLKSKIDRFGKPYQVGHIKNIRVSIYESGTSIEGSLPRYHFGNNFEIVNLANVKSIVEDLSNKLALDLFSANVSRLDFGQTLIMDQLPELYLQSLSSSSSLRSKRTYCEKGSTIPNSVCFEGKGLAFAFYDKIMEAKKKRISIPDQFKECNTLKIELKFEKGLKKTMNNLNVNGSSLQNHELFTIVRNRYIEEYGKIFKPLTIQKSITNLKKPADFFDGLAAWAISEKGYDNVLLNINELMHKRTLNVRAYPRLRAKCKILVSESAFSESSHLLDELTQKVESVI